MPEALNRLAPGKSRSDATRGHHPHHRTAERFNIIQGLKVYKGS